MELSNRTPARKQERQLVFIGAETPSPGVQSGPVLLRHLERFADEFAVTACVFRTSQQPALPFRQFEIPLRKWWLPPSRGKLLTKLARRIKAAWLARQLNLGRDDVVLICPHTSEHILAREVAVAAGARLVSLLHDKWLADDHQAELAATFRASHAVLCVSDALASLVFDVAGVTAQVLRPIGETPLPGQAERPERSVVGIAGGFSRKAIELAADHFDAVFSICPEGEIAGLAAIANVTAHPRTASNRDALVLLRQQCAALFVYLGTEYENYARYSFPSKLVDFAQTGLPIVICTPPETGLGQWAAQNGWRLWLRDPDDAAASREIAALLKSDTAWQEEARQTRALADGEFSAHRIHAQLRATLFD